jgi:FtsP/CotA-like multicopper oxidase with cupredoxin domain
VSHLNTNECSAVTGFGSVVGFLSVAAVASLLAASAQAAAPGIKLTATSGAEGTFTLTAGPTFSSQPDGELIYSWGYGCTGGTLGTGVSFAPAAIGTAVGANCPTAQLPGPTLIVTEGGSFQVTLTNNLPPAAGNTSIVFPGLTTTTTTCPTAQQGLLTCEALHGGTVTYTVQVPVGSAGTHPYYSGTQPDLQIEMGLFGAVIVVPSTTNYANCTATGFGGRREDFRHAPNAYDHNQTCYDREYLTQWSEMDPRIHRQVEAQVKALGACTAGAAGCALNVAMEPYHPNYFLINGRSMPDDMDPNYAPNYPNQPYNGNPHMHPGELILLRVIGQGHWQHPFHEHGNHVRILARDGNLLLSQTNAALLAGRMEFNTDTTPGQSFDGIFYWSGKGLGWDIFGHTAANTGNPPCSADANGYYTVHSPSPATQPSYGPVSVGGVTTIQMTGGSANYYEWCADHNVPLELNPVGQVGGGGPATLMDPLILTNGLWYNGTPYLGPDAVMRSRGPTPLPPGTATQNPTPESGIAFMWHSHNEREITTSDVFPGGMLMMMLVDPYVWYIDETL